MKSSALILPSTLGGVSLRFPLGSFPCLKFLPSHPLFCVWPPMRDYRLAMTLPNSTLHWDDRCKEQATPSTKSLHSHQTMVSQAWHCWHLGLDTSLLWGSVLCNVGCFSILDLYPPDASRMPPPPKKSDNQICLHTLPNVPRGQNHPHLRTTASHQQDVTTGFCFLQE